MARAVTYSVETIVGQMPPSALTPSGQPKMKSSEMCGRPLMTTYAMMASSTTVVMAAATRNTPSMMLFDAFLEMRAFLPCESARLMRWAEVSLETACSV